MKPRPITRQRSPWIRRGQVPGVLGGSAQPWQRNVGDGWLLAFVAEEPAGWHLSISFTDRRGKRSRYPTWDEITHARAELLPGDVAFVMHLPPEDQYVAVHDSTFHLYEHPEGNRADD